MLSRSIIVSFCPTEATKAPIEGCDVIPDIESTAASTLK